MNSQGFVVGSALVLLLAACTGHGASDSAPIGDELADTPSAALSCLSSTIDSLPAVDSFAFVSETCMVFNNDEFEDAANEALDNGDNLVKAAGFTRILRLETANDAVRIAQLVSTLVYFNAPFAPTEQFATMSLAELDAAAENPFWRETIEDSTGEAYTHVNIGQGGNPMEIVFRRGTLEPVAVTQDGDVTFCSAELLGGATPEAPRSCCKVCGDNSQSCGDTCISLDFTCRKDSGCACEG